VRVLFDGYWWAAGPASNRQVMRDLIITWAKLFPDDDVIVAVRKKHYADARETLPPSVRPVRTRLWPQALSNATELSLMAVRLRANLTVAHNFSPLGTNSAVFIHDVLFLTHPEWFSWQERAYFRLMVPLSRFAANVFTSSQSEADRIDASLRLNRAVKSIGLAVGTELALANPHNPARLHLRNGSFVLTVGRLNVRKNLETTVRAAVLSGAISRERPLVIVGEKSGKVTADSAIDSAWVENGWVIVAGFVSTAELAWLYENCALFVFLTLDEGFGLPPLEALSFGAPVLVSDIPVMREVVGAEGTFVRPLDVDAASAAIRRHFQESNKASLDSSLNERRRSYSWESSVRQIRHHVVTSRHRAES
jgi:glycosyltransferase involved in cell wall biosynthesis